MDGGGSGGCGAHTIGPAAVHFVVVCFHTMYKASQNLLAHIRQLAGLF
jgi:hypothetical protein